MEGPPASRYRLEARLRPDLDPTTFRGARVDAGSEQEIALCLVTGEVADAARARMGEAFELLAGIVPVLNVLSLADGACPPMGDLDSRGEAVVVQELVVGPTLEELVRGGAGDPESAVRVLLGVADALDALHAAGGFHGGVTPLAILVGPNGVAQLGLAGVQDSAIAYQSPARLTEEGLSAADDAWALLGCVYFAVTGGAPFHGDNAGALARRVLGGRPAAIRATTEAERDLQTIFDRGFSRSSSKRYTNVSALAADLRSWLLLHAPAVADGSLEQGAPAEVLTPAPASLPPEPEPFPPPPLAPTPTSSPGQGPGLIAAAEVVEPPAADATQTGEERPVSTTVQPPSAPPVTTTARPAPSSSSETAAERAPTSPSAVAPGGPSTTSDGAGRGRAGLIAAVLVAAAATVGAFALATRSGSVDASTPASTAREPTAVSVSPRPIGAPASAPATATATPTASGSAAPVADFDACVAGWFPADSFDPDTDLSFVCSERDARPAASRLRKALLAGGRSKRITEAMKEWQRFGWFEMPVVATVRARCCPDAAPLEVPHVPGSTCVSLHTALQSLGASTAAGRDPGPGIKVYRKIVSCLVDVGDVPAYGQPGAIGLGEEPAFRVFAERGATKGPGAPR